MRHGVKRILEVEVYAVYLFILINIFSTIHPVPLVIEEYILYLTKCVLALWLFK